MFDHLFKSLKMGTTVLPNRICFLSHRTNLAKNGRLTDSYIAYYQRRARGGCGLIIIGELSIHPGDRPWESMIEFYHPDTVKDFHRLTDAVHEHGTKIFANLNHHGFQSSGAITRKEIWGPSDVSDIVFGETAKPMESEDFDVIADSFSEAAYVAREAGFDGVEIDMGPESILRQFLSPLSNHREDEYGGSIENRMRFPLRTLERVREKAGKDFTIGVRLCVDEKFWGAITPEESEIFSKRFSEKGGADFIEISIGTYYNLYLFMASMHTPFGFAIEETERVRKAVPVPVIAAYQINLSTMADKILKNNQADAIGVIRNLICDPDSPKKIQEGRIEDIRYCVRDNKGCIGRVTRLKRIGCIQNPEVGFESTGDAEAGEPAEIKKRVIVIGGGPAGLEAARTARERGHDVVLYEKEADIGGQVNLIKRRPRREGMAAIINHLRHMLEKLQATVVTGKEMTADMVLAEKPDVVIVATGSVPREKPVPGNYGPPGVLNVWDVLRGHFSTGERILFIDENGGHHAASTVEFLADQGKKVHMITGDLFIGQDLGPTGDLYLSRQRLLQKGVTFQTDLIVDGVDENTVRCRDFYTNRQVLLMGYDTIVLDMGNMADDRIYRELKGRVNELYRAGDCVAPRGIDMAVLEGRRAGKMP
ncbi:MAG: FAD-dependent oxidoreductase [Deltaproteobacteria bacterium]|nr:FAD-dependent oxidoreductase [Deltaproteobacteria bacterium]